MTPDAMTLQEVADLLAAMDDEYGVAFLLAMFGVKGRVYDSCECPVARLATMLCGEEVFAAPAYLYLSRSPSRQSPPPAAAAAFMVAFDSCRFPELEAA